MKRALWGLLAAVWISAATGCMMGNNCQTCDGHPTRAGGMAAGCGPGGDACGGIHPRLAALHGGRGGGYSPDFGPPSAAIAYPYYTTRGPRDFLEPAPPTIGR